MWLATGDDRRGLTMFANVRWEVVFALMFACFVCFVVGLVVWMWVIWMIGLLGLLVIVGDIAWTVLSFVRAKRAGEGKLRF
jgi:1,4-dihydroxy-2-naphthoate octaprenyltransferase